MIDMRNGYTVRGKDRHGMGHYMAPRGSRKHKGIDIVTTASEQVCALSNGVVSKIGYPYSPVGPKGHFRYIEIDTGAHLERYFYCFPLSDIEVGASVSAGGIIGVSQGISRDYDRMYDHIHFEVKKKRAMRKPVIIDPNKYLESL